MCLSCVCCGSFHGIQEVSCGIYDIYCTSWDMIEKDAQCDHAHLYKLFESMIVYCKDKSVWKRLDGIRRKLEKQNG